MVCGMIHRSEMQVLSVKFWRCSPISLFAQGVRSLRFGCLSRTNERADRGRTHQRTINTSGVQTAASAHRCGHALAFCALSAPRARVESPGEHENEGLPYVRERTSRTNHLHFGAVHDNTDQGTSKLAIGTIQLGRDGKISSIWSPLSLF